MRKLICCIATLLYCSSGVAKTSAVIEEWSRHMTMTGTYNLTIREYIRVKVLDEHGYEHAVFRDYYDTFKKVRNLRMTILDGQKEKVKSLTRFSALDIMLNPSYAIGDARMLVLDPEYRNYPFTVEVEVEFDHHGFLGFPVWMPRYSHDLEVLRAEMTLQCAKDFKYKSLEVNGAGKPTVKEDGKNKLVRWVLNDLPAVPRHLTYKSLAAEQPKVYLAPDKFMLDNSAGDMSTWAAFGEWYRKLNQGRNELGASTRAYLDSLRASYPHDKAGLTKAIYKHMQNKVRYISIQLGIGGFQAIPALEVERAGYGDCKGLTNYFAAMLNYCYIPSNHVLIQAGAEVPDLLPDFPSSQFNHVFLAVPVESDTLWFESTSQNSPPAYTGSFTDDRFALWISQNSSRLIRTPALSEHQSLRATKCLVRFNDDGDANMQMTVAQSGKFFDESNYYVNLNADKIQKLNYSKFFYKDFQIEAFDFLFPEKEKPLLNLVYKLKVNSLGSPLGGKLVIPAQVLPPLEKNLSLDFLNKKIEIARGFTLTDTVTVSAPPGFRFLALPEDRLETSEFGTFEMRFQQIDAETLLVTRRAVIVKGTYKNERFDQFNKLLQEIRNIEQRKIVLLGKT